MNNLELKSDAFESGGSIPARYTCEGQNVSPALSWRGLPAGAKSLALIFDDPDAPAGVFSHWVVYNIPPTVDNLPEDIPAKTELPAGGVHGRNDFGNTHYEGPCPPLGSTHTYYFRLYALDAMLDITPGANRQQLLDLMRDHILAQTEIQGSFGRS